MSKPHPSLGQFLEPVQSANPIDIFGEDAFSYIDIAAIDRLERTILNPQVVTAADAPSRARQLIKAGDILVSTVRPNLNTVAVVGSDFDGAIASTGFCVLRVKADQLHSGYLFHWIASENIVRHLSAVATGASYPAVSDKIIKSLPIALPALKEQKRISAILDKADSLRRKRQQAIRLADDFLRAVFLEMFGDPVTNPKGWPIEKLRSVTTKITDGTHKSPPMAAAGIPYVTAKHIKQEGVRFDLAPTYISESDHREIYSRCDPTLGDVLYIKDGATTGIACKNNLPGEFSLLSSVALIRPNRDRLRSEYLVELLNNEKFKTALTGDMAGAAIKRFTLSKIGDFKLPIPLIEKQNEFGTIAEKVKTLQIKLRDELKANQALFSAIQSQFF